MPPPPTNNPYQPPQALPTYRGAQVARFDTPPSPAASKVNEDALPAMPTWDSAVTKRVEDGNHRHDAMEMEPLNPSNLGPRRTPSAPRLNGVGYMGPPPARTGTALTSSSYYTDDQSAYRARSPGVASPGPISPYEQPYGDYSHGNQWHSMSPDATSYPHQQQYMAIGTAVSPSSEVSPAAPYRQPSPGVHQVPGMALSTEGARPIPYRQPSPAINQSPINKTMSPANPAPPYRALTPANSTPAYRAMLPPNQEPVYRAMPPPNSEPTYRAMPPPIDTQQAFRETSPSIPSSPPPPFTASPAPYEATQEPGRPPSLLQSGRKPVPNSFKNV
jgi:hypothetical protein